MKFHIYTAPFRQIFGLVANGPGSGDPGPWWRETGGASPGALGTERRTTYATMAVQGATAASRAAPLGEERPRVWRMQRKRSPNRQPRTIHRLLHRTQIRGLGQGDGSQPQNHRLGCRYVHLPWSPHATRR